MPTVFSYLNSPPAAPPAQPQHITQQDEGGGAPLPLPDVEQFDEAAEADLDNAAAEGGGKWIFLDPGTFHGGGVHQTPRDQLATVAANAGTSRPHQPEGTAEATTPGQHPTVLGNINQRGGDFGPDNTIGVPATGRLPRNTATASALVATSHQDEAIKTAADLIAFLEWQSSRRGEAEEQKRFREDALAFPRLLVFVTMRKKSPYIHLVHSAGVYPNIPGAYPVWKGKAVGFLGDKTKFANPQMIELGKTVAWAWDDPAICKDSVVMATYYELPENREKLWTPPGDAPRSTWCALACSSCHRIAWRFVRRNDVRLLNCCVTSRAPWRPRGLTLATMSWLSTGVAWQPTLVWEPMPLAVSYLSPCLPFSGAPTISMSGHIIDLH